jgi:DNA mismatch repair ATPase MutS
MSDGGGGGGILKEYLQIQKKETELCGEQTIVLYQIGKFYELFEIELEDGRRIGRACAMESVLMKMGSSDDVPKGITTFDGSRVIAVYHYGFPMIPGSIDKYLQAGISMGFTFALYHQSGVKDAILQREKRILFMRWSPGKQPGGIGGIREEREPTLLGVFIRSSRREPPGVYTLILYPRQGEFRLIHHEVLSWKKPIASCYSEIAIHNPREIIVWNEDQELLKRDTIISACGLPDDHTPIRWAGSGADSLEINVDATLRDIPVAGLGGLGGLGGEWKRRMIATFIGYLSGIHPELVYEQRLRLQSETSQKILIENSALVQLNILPSNDSESFRTKRDYRSIWNFTDRCVSPMGHREFLKRITEPSFDFDLLQSRISASRKLAEDSGGIPLTLLRKSLSSFPDIDSLFCPSKIGGMSYGVLWKTCNALTDWLNLLFSSSSSSYFMDEWWIPTRELQGELRRFQERIHEDLRKPDEILGEVHPDDTSTQGYDSLAYVPYMFSDSASEERVSRETHAIWLRYKKAFFVVKDWVDYLNHRMETSVCRVVYEQAQDRYFIGITFKSTTAYRKGIQLYELAVAAGASEFTNLNVIDIERGVGKKVSFRAIDDKLTIRGREGVLKEHLQEFTRARHALEKVIFGEWNQWIMKLRDDFTEVLREVSRVIANCDCLQSSAMLSRKEGYRWANLIPFSAESKSEGSCISVKKLRHPLIEAIHQDFPYVPHDVSFGNISDYPIGRLVFGVNSSGKSSLMKAIGIAVIMAQAGLPVACEEMSLRPFRSIFTRILGNDNLFRGYSTFKVESEELISILQEANEWSLVLGDELCSGTEQYGAEAIVCASVLSLLRRRTPFLFATHWHRLRDIPVLVSRKDLGWNHLYVKMDEEGVIRFDRMLMEGAGPRGYAIDFMRQMNAPEAVMAEAEEIRKMLTSQEFAEHSIRQWSQSTTELATTKTAWNPEARVSAICQICKEKPAEETDHIRERHTAKSSGEYLEDGTSVHHGGNLVGLCRGCHQEKTAGRICIRGWREVLEKGVVKKELDFEVIRPESSSLKDADAEPDEISECIYRLSTMGASLRHIQAHLRTTLGLKYKQTEIERILRGYKGSK